MLGRSPGMLTGGNGFQLTSFSSAGYSSYPRLVMTVRNRRHLLMALLNCVRSLTGDPSPKSLEGFFIYEAEGPGTPGSNRRGNDAIVVEQWTVIEVSRNF